MPDQELPNYRYDHQGDLAIIAYHQVMALWKALYCLDYAGWLRLSQDLRDPAQHYNAFG